MYRRIVVPLEGTERAEQALEYARLLAGKFGSSIVALRVLLYNVAGLAPGRDESLAYLQKVTEPLREEGLTVSYKAAASRVPSLSIAAEADREPDGLVCMASQGSIGFKRWFLGNIANEVLKNAKSPVLILRGEGPRGARPSLRNIVAPLDGTPSAEQATPHIEGLSKAFGVPVHAVYVAREVKGRPSPKEMPAYLDRIAARLRKATGNDVQVHILQGDPADAIVGLAKSLPDSLIVMTTHSQVGFHEVFLGAMADRLAHRAEGPILFVHPNVKR